MKMIFTFRKDVRLPIQLQRAMAAEAEAARESRAKVMIIMSLREAFKKKNHFFCDKCHTCSNPPPPPLSVTKNHLPFLVKNGLFRK